MTRAFLSICPSWRELAIDQPTDRLVRDAQRREDLVPEIVTEQQFVHAPQELTGLGALDDAVVVGGGERHDLADRALGELLLGHAAELGRVVHGPDADDRALALHQPRHRVICADRARVRQADRRAGEIVGRQLARAGTANDVFVGVPELREVHRLGGLDAGHDERPRTVLAREVDRDAEVDVIRRRDRGLSVHLEEVVVHLGVLTQRAHHRVADDVREADLAAARPPQVVVDHHSVVGDQLGRDGTHRRRGRHLQRRLHIRHDAGCRAAQLGRLLAQICRCRWSSRLRRRGGRGLLGGRAMAG